MTRTIRKPSATESQGFTLTELAIVLLAAGLIMGTVWVAAGKTWESYHAYRSLQQITKTTQNLREYYNNAQALTAGDITATLDAANLLPVEMRRNPSAGKGQTPIDHSFNDSIVSGAAPANGSFHVAGVACPGKATITCFRIRMLGLSEASCIKMLMALPIGDDEIGIVKIGAQNMASSSTTMTTPMDPATARSWCTQNGATNEVDWDFRLRN